MFDASAERLPDEMKTEDFKTFEALLKACFKLAGQGDRNAAHGLISDYIEKAMSAGTMFDFHNLGQALGFRVEWAEEKIAAQEEYIQFYEWLLNAATLGLIDSYARLATHYFNAGNYEKGREYAKKCYRICGFRGDSSGFVEEAMKADNAARRVESEARRSK